MLAANPKERVSLSALRKHPWVNGDRPSKYDYKKEMNARIKKVMVKVRKEQETEMKQAFMKEKGKKEMEKVESFQLNIRRELEERIIQMRGLVASKDNSSGSHSDSSSFEEHEA